MRWLRRGTSSPKSTTQIPSKSSWQGLSLPSTAFLQPSKSWMTATGAVMTGERHISSRIDMNAVVEAGYILPQINHPNCPKTVMAGPVPAIHDFSATKQVMDDRHRGGHDSRDFFRPLPSSKASPLCETSPKPYVDRINNQHGTWTRNRDTGHGNEQKRRVASCDRRIGGA